MFKITEATFRSLTGEHAGLCVKCMTVSYGVEPDARRYECECCEMKGVYGLEELMLMGLIIIVNEGERENIQY